MVEVQPWPPVLVTSGRAEPIDWTPANAGSGQTWFPAMLTRLGGGGGSGALLLSFKDDCDNRTGCSAFS
eukprot:COSAG05_NODE_14192_length_404_cov_3.278689_1_plen_68_part_10